MLTNVKTWVIGKRYLFLTLGFDIEVELLEILEDSSKCKVKLLTLLNEEEVCDQVGGPGEILPAMRRLIAENYVTSPLCHCIFELLEEPYGKILVTKAVQKHKGKRQLMADELGISQRTLYRKIKEYKL